MSFQQCISAGLDTMTVCAWVQQANAWNKMHLARKYVMISYYLNVCYQIKATYLIEGNEILVWNWHVKSGLWAQDTPVRITHILSCFLLQQSHSEASL